MGYALARTAARRGADVTLISGPTALTEPPLLTTIQVTTALQMRDQVAALADRADIIVKAAAVSDFKPKKYQHHKIKKARGTYHLDLEETPDILAELGERRHRGCILVGFAAESENHESEGRRKLIRKKVDLIVVNDILGSETGFDVDTNQVTLVDKNGSRQLPLLSKEETADRIWDHILSLSAGR